eukprot:1083234-Prymnesium_polylepis.1
MRPLLVHLCCTPPPGWSVVDAAVGSSMLGVAMVGSVDPTVAAAEGPAGSAIGAVEEAAAGSVVTASSPSSSPESSAAVRDPPPGWMAVEAKGSVGAAVAGSVDPA